MEKLIKPADYAKQKGISRQAVYAQIKKGLLPSKSVEGKIYIVQEADSPAAGQKTREPAGDAAALLAAKDETISVLKETIRDLKETNQMITSTLRSEVELLKEAFSEMKTLYAARIEHISREEAPELLEEILEPEEAEEELPGWISLEEFLSTQGIDKKKKRKAFVKRVKRLYKNGDTAIDKEEKAFLLRADKAVEILREIEPT
ncbi:DUF3972 domain-containing protein [Nitratifractor salsuginis]|uniref:DUF3972 domain-containing protein n=1 Tax=Nitratifractor salsuginis (strain DSM 16511 / JCM 12458 / E9I37-1) TaxID=749222 RepID=E6WXX5_NITSE|nr:DUF3972 domain-containing protein [Nitratifractor salsuginis]ADV45296.1 hypothetical protein Nitsa_0022 [Nitratifractor salsuginis DSM 16511]